MMQRHRWTPEFEVKLFELGLALAKPRLWISQTSKIWESCQECFEN